VARSEKDGADGKLISVGTSLLGEWITTESCLSIYLTGRETAAYTPKNLFSPVLPGSPVWMKYSRSKRPPHGWSYNSKEPSMSPPSGVGVARVDWGVPKLAVGTSSDKVDCKR
jgi:hypothetical protein